MHHDASWCITMHHDASSCIRDVINQCSKYLSKKRFFFIWKKSNTLCREFTWVYYLWTIFWHQNRQEAGEGYHGPPRLRFGSFNDLVILYVSWIINFQRNFMDFQGVALRVEIDLAESGHLRPLAWKHMERPLRATCSHSLAIFWSGHLRPLAWNWLERPLAATRGHLRPLAATCGHSSGCKWLQVAASGCKWLRMAAGGF